MLINWFTVIAQVINFLILVWLLKRYLYKPILKAIDEREKLIASKIEDAEKKESDAIKEKDAFKSKNEEFDRQKTALLNQASDNAKEQRLQMMEEAKKESLALREKLKSTLQEEQEHMAHEITQKTKDEVLAITAKVLKDLSGKNLEEQIVHVFVTRLQALSDEEKNNIRSAIGSSSGTVLIRTAFEINSAQQDEIKNAVGSITGTGTSFRFELNADIIGGIELNASGYKVSWNIAEYLSSVNQAMNDLISQQTQTNKQPAK